MLSNMLIPSLEDNLYEGNDKDQIVETFKKMQKTFTSIPEMERNIKDFEVISNKSEDIIKSSEEYSKSMEEAVESKQKFSDFYKSVTEEFIGLDERSSDIEQEVIKVEKENNEYKYQLDSYEIHLKEIESQNLLEKLRLLEEKIEKKKEDVEYYRRNVDEQEAARHFEIYERHRLRKVELEATLSSMKLSDGERVSLYNKALETASKQNQYLTNKKEIQLKEHNEKISELEKKRREHQEKEKDFNEKLNNLSAESGKIEQEINTYYSELERLQEVSGDYWDQDHNFTSEEVKKDLGKVSLEISTYKHEIEELKESVHLKNGKIQGKEYDLKSTEDNMSQRNEILESYQKKYKKLTESVAVHLRLNPSDLFSGREGVEYRIISEERKFGRNIFELNLQLNNLKTEKELIEEDGFTTHPELKKVKDWLDKRGLDLMLGTEYLYNSDISKEQKEAMVANNPMISFSILVEESDINKLKVTLNSFYDKLTIPIFFIERASLIDEGEKGFVFTVGDGSYVYQQKESRLDKNDWANYWETISESFSNTEIEKEINSSELKNIANVKLELKDFYKHYSGKSEMEMENGIKEAKVEIESIEATINGIKKSKEVAQDEISAMTTALENKEAQKEKMSDLNKEFEIFLLKYVNIEGSKKKSEDIVKGLKEASEEVSKVKNLISKFEREGDNEKISKNSVEAKLGHLRRDKETYSLLTLDKDASVKKGNYKESLSLLKSYQKHMSDTEERRKEYQENINAQSLLMDEKDSEIEKLGFEVNFFKKGNITFDQRQLDTFEEKLSDDIEGLRELENSYQEVNTNAVSVGGFLEYLLNELEKGYGDVDPYDYGRDAEQEKSIIEDILNKNKEKLEQLLVEQQSVSKSTVEYRNTMDSFENVKEKLYSLVESKVLADEEWNKERPLQSFNVFDSAFRKAKRDLSDKDRNLEKEINTLLIGIRGTNNRSLITMGQKLNSLLESNAKDYDRLTEYFLMLIEAVDGYKKTSELLVEEAEEGKNDLIDAMIKRSEILYENIRSLEQSSIVKVDGEPTKTILVRWPKEAEEEIAYNFRKFLDRIIYDIENLNLRNVEEKEVEARIEKELKMIKVIDCFAKVDKCDIRVLKPRNKEIKIKEYEVWEKAASWSGGERHSFRMTMFIAFNSLLRMKKMGQDGTSKVLIVDNPFGEASSDHVVEPMIELAKNTNTQLFCLTDIQNENIINSFETVVSNRYINSFGSVSLVSEVTTKDSAKLDTISFYRK